MFRRHIEDGADLVLPVAIIVFLCGILHAEARFEPGGKAAVCEVQIRSIVVELLVVRMKSNALVKGELPVRGDLLREAEGGAVLYVTGPDLRKTAQESEAQDGTASWGSHGQGCLPHPSEVHRRCLRHLSLIAHIMDSIAQLVKDSLGCFDRVKHSVKRGQGTRYN